MDKIKNSTGEQIKKIENRIFEEKNFLLSLKIYYRLIPAAIRWTNAGPIKRISKRMTDAINQANLILEKYNEGVDVTEDLSKFNWPERWAPIEDKVDTVWVALLASGVSGDDADKMTKADLKKIKARVSDFI